MVTFYVVHHLFVNKLAIMYCGDGEAVGVFSRVTTFVVVCGCDPMINLSRIFCYMPG